MRKSRIVLERNCALTHLIFIRLEVYSFGYSISGRIYGSYVFNRQYFTLERLKKSIEQYENS